MESISKLFNVVILVFGIFFVATYLGAAQEDRVLEEHVTTITTKFADTVRKQGKITKKMYNDMVSELDALGILFHIEMVYTKDVITPVTAGVTTTTQESYYTSEIIAGFCQTVRSHRVNYVRILPILTLHSDPKSYRCSMH